MTNRHRLPIARVALAHIDEVVITVIASTEIATVKNDAINVNIQAPLTTTVVATTTLLTVCSRMTVLESRQNRGFTTIILQIAAILERALLRRSE